MSPVFVIRKVESVEIDLIFISKNSKSESLLNKGEIYYFIYLLIQSGSTELDLLNKVEKEFKRSDFMINSIPIKNYLEQYLSPTRILGNLPNFSFTN